MHWSGSPREPLIAFRRWPMSAHRHGWNNGSCVCTWAATVRGCTHTNIAAAATTNCTCGGRGGGTIERHLYNDWDFLGRRRAVRDGLASVDSTCGARTSGRTCMVMCVKLDACEAGGGRRAPYLMPLAITRCFAIQVDVDHFKDPSRCRLILKSQAGSVTVPNCHGTLTAAPIMIL